MTVGAVLSYSSTTDKTGITDLDRTSFTIKPYIRYSLLQEGKVNFFIDGTVFYTTSNNQYADGGGKAEDNKVNRYGIGVEPGIAYRISDSFSLVSHIGALSYTSSKPDKGGKATTTLGLSVANSISFGVYYHF